MGLGPRLVLVLDFKILPLVGQNQCDLLQKEACENGVSGGTSDREGEAICSRNKMLLSLALTESKGTIRAILAKVWD